MSFQKKLCEHTTFFKKGDVLAKVSRKKVRTHTFFSENVDTSAQDSRNGDRVHTDSRKKVCAGHNFFGNW